ncbi:conserved hypothetical lipoprotein [Helicobacter pylori ELS37]|uniref:Conserved hypothetical lipoprotein n=1 Tax=Helicobacter pylori ELS37 TaxID=1055527 RepID=A0ABC7ZHG3_HELPX|nr:hypothetical protein [Helicobacter pylori]AFF20992.1 conserved hypothetical lipoprotein [Helicobacter pylori ELS37]
MKTYQKLLSASCLALYLVGCGNGGSSESPIEMIANSEGAFQIDSKADSVTIQGVKLNRGNCAVSFSQVYARSVSVQDFKNEASAYEYIKDKKRLADMQNKISQLEQKGLMMEHQTLKFGEKIEGISQGCDIIEAEIQTDKGSWTFNFNR